MAGKDETRRQLRMSFVHLLFRQWVKGNFPLTLRQVVAVRLIAVRARALSLL